MKTYKVIFFSIVSIISLGVIFFLVFFVSSLFVDEFHYVYVTFSDDALSVVTDPGDLFEKKVSRWTDVSATFKNNSQTECIVVVQSETLEITFNLDPEFVYGILLPKKEDISISFCGAQKNIYLN